MKLPINGSGFVFFVLLTLAVSAFAPREISASGAVVKDPLDTRMQQGGAPVDSQQTRLSQRPQRANHEPNTDRRPRSSGNGEGHSQGRPPQPNPDPRPSRPPGPGGPGTGNPGMPGSGPSRPPTHHRPPGHPSPQSPPHHYPPIRPRPGHTFHGYRWGGGNGWRLRHFFLGNTTARHWTHRHHFYVGGYFPFIYLPQVQPIPEELMTYLPPVPPGYEIGYYDGYCFVYDVYTLRIVDIIDLYRY